ncbi:MAG: hypothetical protein WAK25_07095, partial [Acidobacteriaceae bacterium]
AHKVPLMFIMSIVIAEDATVVDAGHVPRDQREIVLHHFTTAAHPYFFAQHSDPAAASKTSCVVGDFPEL